MSKPYKILFLILIVLMAVGFIACVDNSKVLEIPGVFEPGDGDTTSEAYVLDFISDGLVHSSIKTNGKEAVTLPPNPQKEGFTFHGWFWDENVWQRPFNTDYIYYSSIAGSGKVYAYFSQDINIIINQIYGLGEKSNDNQAVSHSFVELYNPTDKRISLDGLTLYASSGGTQWNSLNLAGYVHGYHSFLILLTKYSNASAPLQIDYYDTAWHDVAFSNKNLKVALISGSAPLLFANPFDSDGKGYPVDGYIDMLSISGNDNAQGIDGYETSVLAEQSKQKSARRIDFADTDNNAADIDVIDYRLTDNYKYRPRSMNFGVWQKVEDEGIASINSNLPQIYIVTNYQPITDKINYVPASVGIFNAGEDNIHPLSAGIRIRGNYTSTLLKKPYRIKFDKSIGLFGEPANKSWVLLADYVDPSFVKNYGALTLAQEINPDAFVPMAIHVEVYLNGAYQGLYLLTDQIQENEGRLGIEDQYDPSLEEIPFLVELDINAEIEGILGVNYFVLPDATGTNKNFMIKFPGIENGLTPAQFEYIKNYITAVNQAVIDGTYAELIDVDSFIDYYLVQEFYGNPDYFLRSNNMSKVVGEKLKMGPVWDFDWSVGGPVFYHIEGTNWNPDANFIEGTWFNSLLQHEDFVIRLTQRWEGVLKTLCEKNIQDLTAYKSHINDAALRDQILWRDAYMGDDGVLPEIATFEGHYEMVISFLTQRIDVLDDLIAALTIS